MNGPALVLVGALAAALAGALMPNLRIPAIQLREAPLARLMVIQIPGRYGRWLQRTLVQAGRSGPREPGRWMTVKYLLALGLALLPPLTGEASAAPLGGLLGFLLPDLVLLRRASMRKQRIRRELPSCLDLLSLLLQAGMEIRAALRLSTRGLRSGPLKEELTLLQGDLALGLSTAEALRRLAVRIDAPELRSFAIGLARAERWGVGLEGMLDRQAEGIRGERMNQAERAGHRAATKIILPVLLLIVPAAMILLIGVAVSGVAPYLISAGVMLP